MDDVKGGNILFNNKNIDIPSGAKSIKIINGKILIDDVDVTPENEKNIIHIVINGNIEKLDVSRAASIVVNGSTGNVDLGTGNVNVTGDVLGRVSVDVGNISANDVYMSAKVGTGDIEIRK